MRTHLFLALFALALPMLGSCDQDQDGNPAPSPASAASDVPATPPAPEAPDEDTFDYDGLPPGIGREEVFVTCSGCHSLKLVEQQQLSRHRWEEILDWMVDEQGMTALTPPEHATVVNYLVTHYGLPE